VFNEANINALTVGGWKVFANKICSDWEFAVTTIR
jgi:hypothetical protein